MITMDNFNLRKYLAEGKLLKESNADSIIDLLTQNQEEVAKETDTTYHFPFDEITIDGLDDASIVLKDEIGGMSFRYPEDVDDEFVGENDSEPKPVTIGGGRFNVYKI